MTDKIIRETQEVFWKEPYEGYLDSVLQHFERKLRWRIADEIIDIRRTSGSIKGAANTLTRELADRVLEDAAHRVLYNKHKEDEYPEDWHITAWMSEKETKEFRNSIVGQL